MEESLKKQLESLNEEALVWNAKLTAVRAEIKKVILHLVKENGPVTFKADDGTEADARRHFETLCDESTDILFSENGDGDYEAGYIEKIEFSEDVYDIVITGLKAIQTKDYTRRFSVRMEFVDDPERLVEFLVKFIG